jgi:hypothetical protein
MGRIPNRRRARRIPNYKNKQAKPSIDKDKAEIEEKKMTKEEIERAKMLAIRYGIKL